VALDAENNAFIGPLHLSFRGAARAARPQSILPESTKITNACGCGPPRAAFGAITRQPDIQSLGNSRPIS
jgi:hypothetical protein